MRGATVGRHAPAFLPLQSAQFAPEDCGMSTLAARRAATLPFTLLGVAAIVAGGLLAARTSAQPVSALVWLVAYLVLVVGLAQYALGLGQARLAAGAPSLSFVTLEWLVFNLGNAATILGTLAGEMLWSVAGSLLVAIATLQFAWGAFGARSHPWWRMAYYAVDAIIFASAITGVILAVRGRGY